MGALAELSEKNRKLEELVSILSRGKYIWESTFDAITSPVLVVSGNYDILRANLSAARVADMNIRDMIGQKCYAAFAGRESVCDGCPLNLTLSKGLKNASSILGKGKMLEFEVSTYPLKAKGLDIAAIAYYRDITQERRLQRELMQQEKMAAIGMLAGGVAHEINNPLGGLIAFVQLMKKDAPNSEHLMSDLCEVEDAAKRCKKIVADLLDFSRMSRDGELHFVDINNIIKKTATLMRSDFKKQKIDFNFDACPQLPPVMGLSDRLQQVVLNLMTNACHAMSQGGTLTAKTNIDKESDNIIVRIKDTGDGIPDEVKGSIFDPFFTTKEQGKGTGLGLSISYRIIKEHGGKIEFSSEVGVGTEFILWLPVFHGED